MPCPTPSELALRMGARSKRADALKDDILPSVQNEIEEVETLYKEGAIGERDYYTRLRRLGLDFRAVNERRRQLRI